MRNVEDGCAMMIDVTLLEGGTGVYGSRLSPG
jgi:hypothetical protein